MSNAIYAIKYKCTCGCNLNKITPEGDKNRMTCDKCGKFIKWIGKKELESIRSTLPAIDDYSYFVKPIETIAPIDAVTPIAAIKPPFPTIPINTPDYPNLGNCIKYIQDYLKNEYNSNSRMILSSNNLMYVEVIE